MKPLLTFIAFYILFAMIPYLTFSGIYGTMDVSDWEGVTNLVFSTCLSAFALIMSAMVTAYIYEKN